MIEVLRRNQRILWIVIGFLAIPFIFYFVEQPDFGAAPGRADYGAVGEHKITHAEVQRSLRFFELAQQLGMFSYLQDMTAGANSEDEAVLRFTASRILLDEKFQQLGIEPTPGEVANVVRKLPAFATNGQFDVSKYNLFAQNALGSLGFSETQLEELAGDQWSLDRLKQLVGVGINLPEAESRRNFEQAYGKMDVVVARFDKAQLEKDLQISEEEITKFYEARKDTLKSEERRTLQVASMTLSEEQKKLTGKDRIDLLQNLANTASNFMQELSAPGADFAQVAAKGQVPVQTTDEFTLSQPPPLLQEKPQLLQAAASLTPQQPTSDIVQTPEGFHAVRLADFKPAQPLSLEEARPKIIEQIRTNQVRTKLAANATAASQQLRDQLKGGAPAEAAIAATGLKPERVPPFALLDEEKPSPTPTPAPSPSPETSPAASPGASPPPTPTPEPEPPDMNAIKSAVAQLNAGEVSPFVPTETGGILVVLEKRHPVNDPALQAKRETLNASILAQQRNIAFYEWLRQAWEQKRVVLPAAQPNEQQRPAGG